MTKTAIDLLREIYDDVVQGALPNASDAWFESARAALAAPAQAAPPASVEQEAMQMLWNDQQQEEKEHYRNVARGAELPLYAIHHPEDIDKTKRRAVPEQPAAPAGPFPVASKSHGAWDGIEDVLAMPDGTDIYTASQVQAMRHGSDAALKSRLLTALERASLAECALRALIDECESDSIPGWEDRMNARINAGNAMLAAAPSGPAREPLSQERLQFLSGEYEDIPEEGVAFRDGWRSAEMHHGITAAPKGAQHGTE